MDTLDTVTYQGPYIHVPKREHYQGPYIHVPKREHYQGPYIHVPKREHIYSKLKLTSSKQKIVVFSIVTVGLLVSVVSIILTASYLRCGAAEVTALKEQLKDSNQELEIAIEELRQRLNVTQELLSAELNTTQENLNEIVHKIRSFHQQSTSGRNCTEDYEYNPFSNTCFRIITIQKVWENAKEFCEADGEYLATFHSLESFSWFLNLRKTNPAWRVSHSWVGGRKSPDGIWRWTGRVTGPIMFNVWQDDRPDNEPEECMNSSSLRGDARFNDDDCNLTLNVVCETD